jgi:orotidine-5'-phosphate decarboxylase
VTGEIAMNTHNRIIIALDMPGAEEAERFLSRWNGLPKPFIKVGYQLFFAVGPHWVAKRKEEGYSVFLDLKLHDIPNTVAHGVESLARLGVDFLTLHASGGREMIAAARERTEAAASAGQRTKLLAVTHLTSTDEWMYREELGMTGSLAEGVLRLARLAYEAGADGVVCSGLETARVKRATSPSFFAVTPGIRPDGAATGDQKRVVTPADAIRVGADYLVIGRPITKAEDPVAVWEAIAAEMEQAGM